MKMLILLLSVLISGLSCSKKSTVDKDTILPVIIISNPAGGQTFTSGQTISISGTITDNNYIAEVHIHVTNTNTGTLLMDVHLYPGGSSATFNQSITATAGVNYKIQVIAKDRAVNEAISSVEVTCN